MVDITDYSVDGSSIDDVIDDVVGSGDDGNIFSGAWDWLFGGEGGGGNWDTVLALLGGAGAAGNLFGGNNNQRVGYQGGIPERTAVRSQVQYPDDPNRVPGSGGRRNFSDVVYAERPEAGDLPSIAQAQAQADAQAQQFAQNGMAGGGLATLNRPQGYYMGGSTDGMGDQIPATINNQQPAALSHGEYVVPADVVGHLGNGNSEAGAKQLNDMMGRIRQARTGMKKQAPPINPQKYLA